MAISGHPPKPALAFRVGVTGHRHLRARATAHVGAEVSRWLAAVAAQVSAVQLAHPQAYRTDAPALFVLSQLAIGADQLVAREAVRQGYRLRAILPFPIAQYRTEFADQDAEALDELIGLSDQLWILPPSDAPHARAYGLAGEVTVAHCDLLLAIWDGQAARGQGGTADVVDQAIQHGVPVIRLSPHGDAASVLWPALEGLAPDRQDRHSVPRRPLTEELLAEIVFALTAPPEPANERAAIAEFLREPAPRLQLRPEYPLLLAACRIQPFRRDNVICGDFLASTAEDWRTFNDHPHLTAVAPDPGLQHLQEAYAWSDALANTFAQTYRSALVFNYVAAALSVLLALVGLLAPELKIWLLVSELILVSLLITNTTVGNRRQWHRRWLDYRQIAEQLRPMRSLRLLGAAGRRRSCKRLHDTSWRWTDWYATAIWRELGTPPPPPAPEELPELVTHLTARELVPQIQYNRLNAERMHKLDHRLHEVGTVLFFTTACLGVASLVGVIVAPGFIHDQSMVLTVLSAGLPMIGSALFGIRGQGDFVGASGRAAETADRLQSLVDSFHGPEDLAHASRAFENAAEIMMADLGEWRVSYKHRTLAIPA